MRQSGFTVYKIKPHRDWIIENYGIWTANVGLVRSRHVMEMTIPMRRKNLALETITTSVVITDNNTFNNLDDLRYPDIDTISKCGYRQLTSLYDFINATRKMIYAVDWGYYINGSWTGILGHMVQGEAELSGSVMFINKERMSVLEFLTHPIASSVKFIFREPPLSFQNNLYLLPFNGSVWYCFGSFVVIMITVMYVNAYWEKRKFRDEEDRETSTLIPKISDVAVVVVSAITQQGSTVEFKGTLGRFVIFVLFLMFLFLYTAYSANIVVLLQSSSGQIRTLSDLLYSKLELGVEDTPYNRHYFSIQKEPVRKAIYEKKIVPKGSKPNFYNLEDGVRHLQKTPFAFHCLQGSAYKVIEKYFYEHEKCGLREITYYQDVSPWQSCRKESPYKEIFKIGLFRNMETGLDDRAFRLIFSKKPVCSARGGNFVSVSLVDCYPVLLLLLYGMILGVVILLAEVLHYRRNTRNRG
ncbi:hypothetical protein MSG28_014355 [Choristoneura fumiferana]|uniref:Uncharacterized protein n=1 Tax=Choristoneura fumiferana TaxID=7141 RepID=A0ACC0JGT0_CHOFU|nr:hypothetical protein MSG28_014355 [Choristoneura fumiferana]